MPEGQKPMFYSWKEPDMNDTKRIHPHSLRTSKYFALALLAVVGLSLTGCSNQMAIMQENQANLQVLVQQNAHQLSDVVGCMEQGQQALEATILDLRETTKQLSEDMTQVTVTHAAFKDTVKQNNAEVASRVNTVEQAQEALSGEFLGTAQERQKLAASIDNGEMKQAELEQVVEDNKTVFLAKVSGVQDSQVEFQAELKSLKATIQTAVSDISAVARAQKTLEDTISSAVSAQLAAMHQVQTQQQSQLDASEDHIANLLNSLTGLESNLTQLESTFKKEIEGISRAVELADHRQEEFQAKTNQQVLMATQASSTVKEGQNNLAVQVGEFQTSTQSMIDTLRVEVDRVRSVVSEISAISMNTPDILTSDASEE